MNGTVLQKQRNSSIELLKIIAIAMIVLSHSMPSHGSNALISPGTPSDDIQLLTAALLCYPSQIGNTVFIICSSWFLTGSNNVSGKKIMHMIGNTFVISAAWLIAAYNLKCLYSGYEILNHIFPITFTENWFVGCYILFYAIHPFLNQIISSMTKQKHLTVNLIFIFLYVIINQLLPGAYFFNNLTGFICIYFFTSYAKLYMPETSGNIQYNIILLLTGIIGIFASVVLTNYLGMRGDVYIQIFKDFKIAPNFDLTRWSNFTNPFIIMTAFALFNIFRAKCFYSRAVNFISSLSLLVYMIHENYFMITYIRNDIFAKLESAYSLKKYGIDYLSFSTDHLVLWILEVAAATFAVSVIIAALYKLTLEKAVYKVCGLIAAAVKKVHALISDKLMKLG